MFEDFVDSIERLQEARRELTVKIEQLAENVLRLQRDVIELHPDFSSTLTSPDSSPRAITPSTARSTSSADSISAPFVLSAQLEVSLTRDQRIEELRATTRAVIFGFSDASMSTLRSGTKITKQMKKDLRIAQSVVEDYKSVG